MSANAVVRARIDEQIKEETSVVLAAMGLTLSDALRMMLSRERTGMSQTRFAFLIGVKPKTLQNWEQRRVRPAGPARELLKIVDANPQALSALHA